MRFLVSSLAKLSVTQKAFIIFFVSLCLFLCGDPKQEIVNFDVRFAVFAKDLFYYPLNIFPTIFGQPYPDYLSSGVLLIYLASLPFQEVTYLSAILPSAMFSSLTLVTIFLFGLLVNEQLGIVGVLFALMTHIFLMSSLQISLDIYPTFACILACYCFALTEKNQSQHCILIYVLIAIFGYIFRGPIGFIMVGSVVVASSIAFREWRLLRKFASISFVALILLLAATLGLAYLSGGYDYLQDVIKMQVVQRIHRVNFPYYHYIPVLFSSYMPAFLVAAVSCIAVHKELKKSPNSYVAKVYFSLTLWVLMVVLGMSIPAEKKARYILEITPALALMSGFVFTLPGLHKIRRVASGLFLMIPAITLILLWICFERYQGISEVSQMKSMLLMVSAFLLIAQLLGAIVFVKNKASSDVLILVMTSLSVVIVTKCIIQPLNPALNAAQPFVALVEKCRSKDSGDIYFYQVTKDSSDIKYFLFADYPVNAHYIRKPIELLQVPNSAYVLMRDSVYQGLNKAQKSRFEFIQAGQLGRRDMVVIQKKFN